jgi:hypothetical protein
VSVVPAGAPPTNTSQSVVPTVASPSVNPTATSGAQATATGPVIGTRQTNPAAVEVGGYAPYVVERWTKVQSSELDLYYVLSAWNPYVVVLIKSRLQLE